MVICQQARDLHHENSSREAKTTHSFCHWQRRNILSKHTSEGLGLTFKDYMHCMSVQVIQIHSVYPESKAGSVSTIRSEALFIRYFDAYSTDRNCTLQMCKNSRFLPWRPNCLNRPKKQQKTKMKLKSEVKIWQFVIQLVTVVKWSSRTKSGHLSVKSTLWWRYFNETLSYCIRTLSHCSSVQSGQSYTEEQE